VYGARAYRSGGSGTITILEASNTNAAVAATAGVIRRAGNGSVARTEFSSSTGGWTSGGTFPSVVDDGDATPSNPNHDWTTTITAANLTSRYGMGSLLAATVTARSSIDNRAVTGLRLDFAGGSVTRTGEQFRQEWGLRSSWFDLTAAAGTPAHPSRVGVRRGNEWYLRYALAGGPADVAFGYGIASDAPVVGDWNGDAIDTVGVRRGVTWLLRNSSSSGAANLSFDFGNASDVPLVGDWDGNDTTTIGVRRGNVYYLRNTNSEGAASVSFGYGVASDVPVSGDWDGNGTDTPGIFRDGTFHLRNSNSSGAANSSVDAGITGAPVVGDWDGDGVTDLGVLSGSTFHLFRSTTGASMGSFAFGITSDVPVAGAWK
jgi:hypothetical protein